METALDLDMASAACSNCKLLLVQADDDQGDGHDADEVRNLALDHFNISYGTSFGPFRGKYFRIGHLGDTNDLTILGALAGTEM